MANVKCFSRLKRTSSLHATTAACVAKISAPANQGIWAWVSVFGKDATNAEMTRWELRTGTSGGTFVTGAVEGPNRTDPREATTVQATVTECTANATNDGTVIDSVLMGSGRQASFQPVYIKAGTSVFVFADCPTVTTDYDICIKHEE